MVEKPPPSAALRLMMSNFQQNPAMRFIPGAGPFLGAFAALVECAEAQDARIAQLEQRLRGMDEASRWVP